MTDFDRDEERALFEQYHRTRDRAIRNDLVERHIGFATHIAQRFAPGRIDEDMKQAAMFGLVKAVDRFDPERGIPFGAFATPTIEGEIKRHYRDKTWKVRVPRRAKELHLLVRDAGEVLASRLGRSPRIEEIADYLAVDTEDVMRGLSATAAYDVASIDVGADDDDDAPDSDRDAHLAFEERGFDDHLDQRLVRRALDALPDRERRIVELRFFGEMTQSEIADEMGISQMHVSRLLRSSYTTMRSHLDGEVAKATDRDD